MRCLLATCLCLSFIVSCGESPPAQQAAPAKSITKTPPTIEVSSTEKPVAEVQPKPHAAEPFLAARTSRLAVGDQAPNFRLQDQTDTERTLDNLLANGKVALVFYRSADW